MKQGGRALRARPAWPGYFGAWLAGPWGCLLAAGDRLVVLAARKGLEPFVPVH